MGALEVDDRQAHLTSDATMPYKSCRDFVTLLRAGDRLQFKLGGCSAGIFTVMGLPNNDATLLLVVRRHDAVSTAVSFESHVFANLPNAQVAIIDTYKGEAKALPSITDLGDEEEHNLPVKREQLRYRSVVGLREGEYEVELKDGN